jgi:hypothetical protein
MRSYVAVNLCDHKVASLSHVDSSKFLIMYVCGYLCLLAFDYGKPVCIGARVSSWLGKPECDVVVGTNGKELLFEDGTSEPIEKGGRLVWCRIL